MEEWGPVVDGAVGVPTGTVTFLLTGIEGSTRQWEQEADQMAAAVGPGAARDS